MRRCLVCLLIAVAVILMNCPVVKAVSVKGISAKAYVLIEEKSGEIILSKNEHMILPMASTTKIMTTLLLIESGNLDEEFQVDDNAIMVEGSSMGLQKGDVVTKRALCYGMMLPSGNDAANQTAFTLAGDSTSFSEIMNKRAAQIGLSNTNFVTPSGLHDDKHYSTAYDMAMLTREALKNDIFREICGTDSIKLSFGNPPYERWLTNTNKLLKQYEYCCGVKTGFTDEAGRCLVSTAQKDGVSLICVTLNAPSDWNDHKSLYDYGFSVTNQVEIDYDLSDLSVNVAGGNVTNIAVVPSEIPVYTQINKKKLNLTPRVNIKKFIYAPVESNQYVGNLEFYVGDILIFSTELITTTGCEAVIREYEPTLYEKIIDYIKKLL